MNLLSVTVADFRHLEHRRVEAMMIMLHFTKGLHKSHRHRYKMHTVYRIVFFHYSLIVISSCS